MNEITLYKGALDARAKQIAQLATPSTGLDAARVLRLAMRCVEKDDKLRECSPESFAMAVMSCVEMGLEPALGQAYIIPFKKRATLVLGYQGMIELSFRSGLLRSIWAEVVYDTDTCEVNLGTERSIRHVRGLGRPGKIVGAYAVGELPGGGKQWVYLDRAQIEARAPATDKPDNPWNSWPEEMCKKTAVRALWKLLPKSPTMRLALLQSGREDGHEPQRPETIAVDAGPIAVSQPWDRPAIEAPQATAGEPLTLTAGEAPHVP